MTMTTASKPVCDPTLTGVFVDDSGPDSVEACGEAGEATLTGRYRRWDATGAPWFDYRWTVQRTAGCVITVTLDDGEGEVLTQTGCQPSDGFGIDILIQHVPSEMRWFNAPCHPEPEPGYIVTGSAIVRALSDSREYTKLLIEDEAIVDRYQCDLTYSCTPNVEACQ